MVLARLTPPGSTLHPGSSRIPSLEQTITSPRVLFFRVRTPSRIIPDPSLEQPITSPRVLFFRVRKRLASLPGHGAMRSPGKIAANKYRKALTSDRQTYCGVFIDVLKAPTEAFYYAPRLLWWVSSLLHHATPVVRQTSREPKEKRSP